MIFATAPTTFGGGPSIPERILNGDLPAVAFFAIAALLTLASTAAMFRPSSVRAVAAAFLLLTTPALVVVVLGPAIVLILGTLTN